jgi:hypothetical protein
MQHHRAEACPGRSRDLHRRHSCEGGVAQLVDALSNSRNLLLDVERPVSGRPRPLSAVDRDEEISQRDIEVIAIGGIDDLLHLPDGGRAAAPPKLQVTFVFVPK